jgi:hypothetical protein
MNNYLHNRRRSVALIFLLILASHPAWGEGTAPASFEIDLNELKKTTESVKKQSPPKAKPPVAEPRQHGSAHKSATGAVATYTVKPGDNLFRILMRDFGMSNREAELLIPEIVRINGLASSTSLSTGKKLTIPLERRSASHHRIRKTAKPAPAAELPTEAAVEPSVEQKTEPVQPQIHETTEGTSAAASPAEASEENGSAPPTSPAAQTTGETASQQSDDFFSPISVKSVTGSSPDDITDGLLTAMMLSWEPDKVIDGKSTAAGAGDAFSVKVDRYLTYKGKRYVITVNSMDPFTYTMLRLVEAAEYKVIHLDGQSNFVELAANLLTQLGIPFAAGKYRFTPKAPESGKPREIDGFMVAFTDRPTRIFLTNTPLDPVTAESLASFTAEKL